jgi:hypothetical protein
MRDTSLDDFAGDDEPTEATGGEGAEAVDAAAEGGTETGDDAGADGDAGEGTDLGADTTDGDATDDDAPAPAVSTYDWTPSGADCATCGAVVEKRWRNGDGALVCADCKEW